MGVRITGASSASNRLKNYALALKRETVSVLKQEARGLAIALGSATQPNGLSEGGSEKFENRVEADVRKVFASRKSPGAIYLLLQQQAPHLAGAYWSATKKGRTRAVADILRRANLPQGIDANALKTARRGKQGRVLKNQVPVSLATEAQVRVAARKQRQLVGLAKAGWYCAAKGLGGRIRRNTVSASGTRSTSEVFPPYVKRLARKFPNLGGARISGGEVAPRIEIFTSVKHATAALPAGAHAAAVDNARRNVKRDLELAMKSLNRGGRKVA